MHPSDKNEFFSITHWVVTALDFLAIYAGGFIAFQVDFAGGTGWAPLRPDHHMLVIGTAACVALLLGNVLPFLRGEALAKLLGFVTLGWLVGWLLAIGVLVVAGSAEPLAWGALAGWAFAAALALVIGRSVAFVALGLLYRAGYQRKSVLLYGDAKLVGDVRNQIMQSASSGFEIVKTIIYAEGKNISAAVAAVDPDEIWISLRQADEAQVERIVQALPPSKANVRLVPDLSMFQFPGLYHHDELGIPMVDVAPQQQRPVKKK